MDCARAIGRIRHAAREQPERDDEHRAQSYERPHRDARSLAACAEHARHTLRRMPFLTTSGARDSMAAQRMRMLSYRQ
jgi:hypothetical protein